MKTIKIIDLLNKIAKGEEVPKKIRFDNTNWNRICGEKYVYYVNDTDSDLFIYFFRKNLTFTLNDEVEIIEEELSPYVSNADLLKEITMNRNKINEILREIIKLKEK